MGIVKVKRYESGKIDYIDILTMLSNRTDKNISIVWLAHNITRIIELED